MEETLEILQENLGKALLDTAYMVVISAVIGVVLGTAVALLLYLTENRLFTPNRTVNVIVGFIVNAIRSLPFLILMVVLIPVAQLLLGDPYTPTGGVISYRLQRCRSSRESRKVHSPKLIRAFWKRPFPQALRPDRSSLKRFSHKHCRRLSVAWC